MEKPDDAESKRAKNLIAATLGLLALLGGAGGADAAGYTLDPTFASLLKNLGGGSILLILYLELRLVPIGLRIVARDKREAAAEATAVPKPSATVQTGRTPRMAVVRPDEGGSIVADVLVALAFLACISGMGLLACGWLRNEAKQTTGNVVDCSTAKAKEAIGQFAPTLEQLVVNTLDTAGKADWNMIESATKGYVAEVGGCVLQSVVTRLLDPPADPGAPSSSPLELDKADMAQRWDRHRTLRYGGVLFKGAQ